MCYFSILIILLLLFSLTPSPLVLRPSPPSPPLRRNRQTRRRRPRSRTGSIFWMQVQSIVSPRWARGTVKECVSLSVCRTVFRDLGPAMLNAYLWVLFLFLFLFHIPPFFSTFPCPKDIPSVSSSDATWSKKERGPRDCTPPPCRVTFCFPIWYNVSCLLFSIFASRLFLFFLLLSLQ